MSRRRPTDSRLPPAGATDSVRRIVTWYFEHVYGRREGPDAMPFYCDPERVGHFAVSVRELAAGSASATFRLFVAMSMYQARRDVVIMRQQRSMSATTVASLADRLTLGRRIAASPCEHLASAAAFERGCTVRKERGSVTCDLRVTPCHVKEGSDALLRTGEMGKIPTSALLRFWRPGLFEQRFDNICCVEKDPQRRASLLVDALSTVSRVGVKLATMFVSALSVPELAPGLTPWFPTVDGSSLVVVDTNVARVVDVIRNRTRPNNYEAIAGWVRRIAKDIDLKTFSSAVRSYSPRLVQQALYHFGGPDPISWTG